MVIVRGLARYEARAARRPRSAREARRSNPPRLAPARAALPRSCLRSARRRSRAPCLRGVAPRGPRGPRDRRARRSSRWPSASVEGATMRGSLQASRRRSARSSHIQSTRDLSDPSSGVASIVGRARGSWARSAARPSRGSGRRDALIERETMRRELARKAASARAWRRCGDERR